MKKAANHKNPKHKRSKKRKELRRRSNAQNNIHKRVEDNFESSIHGVQSEQHVEVKRKRMLQMPHIAFFELLTGFFGFLSGGFVVVLKMPYLVSIFVK
jgi:hypothetical protein